MLKLKKESTTSKSKETKQIVEIHIYVHQQPIWSYNPLPNVPPSNTPTLPNGAIPYVPNYITFC